ncbi:MAG: 50S ribosomal protein L35 [Pseudomonadota bacterium]
MPKQKTHRASAKRFSFTANGKVKRASAYKQHILTKKKTKRTRKLRKTAYASATEAKIIRRLVPYK